jgi:enoyl-CoA hydratase/carnithine racemase
MKGKPYSGRIVTGLRKPKDTRPGRDVAGKAEAVGRNVTQIKPVGVGLHPGGGGGTERLPHLVGRGRALEIVLGANDFDGDTAERYGYVNRALPDAELDGFVDALARRIASFDRRAIAAGKSLINQVSLPSADRLLDAITSFETALTWPETQQRVKALFQRGLQQDRNFEKEWPAVLGTLLEA